MTGHEKKQKLSASYETFDKNYKKMNQKMGKDAYTQLKKNV